MPDAARAWQEALQGAEAMLATDPKDAASLNVASRASLHLAQHNGTPDLARKALGYAERMLQINPAPAQEAWLAEVRAAQETVSN